MFLFCIDHHVMVYAIYIHGCYFCHRPSVVSVNSFEPEKGLQGEESNNRTGSVKKCCMDLYEIIKILGEGCWPKGNRQVALAPDRKSLP